MMGTIETQGQRQDDGSLGQGSGSHTVFMVEARLAPGVDPLEPIILGVNRAEDGGHGGHSGLVRTVRLTHDWQQIPKTPRYTPDAPCFDFAMGCHGTHAKAMAHAWGIVASDPAVRVQTCVTPVDIAFSYERKAAPIKTGSTDPFRSIQFCGYPPFGDENDKPPKTGLEASRHGAAMLMHSTGLENFLGDFHNRCMQIGRTLDLNVYDPVELDGAKPMTWRIKLKGPFATYTITAHDALDTGRAKWSSHVGCIVRTKKGKRRDLPDGRYVEETWSDIIDAIRNQEAFFRAKSSRHLRHER